MRILLVIHGYPPYYMAGSEVYTYNLARELAKTNDVFVFHRIEDKDIPLHQFFDSFEEGVHIRKINNYEPTPATFYDKYLNPETGAFDMQKANLMAYSHGKYYELGEFIGKFGWSVQKKK